MTPPKPSANVRRLAKLLRQYAQSDAANGDYGYGPAAAFLAARGVLAVSSKTVTGSDAALCLASYDAQRLRVHLRSMARGGGR